MSAISQVAVPSPARSRELWPWCLLAGLLLLLYGPVLAQLVTQWWQDPNYGHGFLVPVLSAYVLWRNRAEWRAIPLRPRFMGAVIMLLALGLLAAGTLGAELFISRVSLLVMLGGMVAFFAGWRMLRAWRFPFAFLLFMIPLPAIIYYQITFPLQLLASRVAGFCLDLLQVPALREGNLIVLPNTTLAVAEACSGIRSLLSLLALAVAYGYLIERRNWKRLVLVVLMVPIAIVTNALRIVGTGVLTYAFGPRWAEGFFHAFSGWLIFLSAFGLMLLAHRGLQGWGRPRFEELP